MNENSQSGSMMVNVMILAAISGALISGMTKVINRDMKAARQQEVRDAIASAQRILQKRFSCEASLGLSDSTLLTACPENTPVLDNQKDPLLDSFGRLGTLDIYIRTKCDISKGIRFEYVRAMEKDGKLEVLPDPLTGKKKDFENLYEQGYFCARFLPNKAASPELASKGLPQVSCGDGRAWSGMKDGVPQCSSPAENLRTEPACTPGVPAKTKYMSNCAFSLCVNLPMGSTPGVPGTCKPGEIGPLPVCTMKVTGPFFYSEVCT